MENKNEKTRKKTLDIYLLLYCIQWQLNKEGSRGRNFYFFLNIKFQNAWIQDKAENAGTSRFSSKILVSEQKFWMTKVRAAGELAHFTAGKLRQHSIKREPVGRVRI